jgi:hypothetical protein
MSEDKEKMIALLDKSEAEMERLKKDIRKFMRVENGDGFVIWPMENLKDAIECEFGSLLKDPVEASDFYLGDNWTFEIVEMSMFDYRKLPEYGC